MGSCRCCSSNNQEVDTTIFGLEDQQTIELADPDKENTISEEEFLKESKTGDLLLYTSHGFLPSVTRSATNSEYDHVAMVVKSIHENDEENQLFIFESVNQMGVRMCDWNDVREDIGGSMQGKSFRNVVYRSVEFNREENLRYLY